MRASNNGERVVMGKEELNPKTPVAPIDMTKDLSCPLLGLFGNHDRAPSPEQVNQHEAQKHGKTYDFHRYDGAGHGFFYWHRPLYRPEQPMDRWSKIFAFIAIAATASRCRRPQCGLRSRRLRSEARESFALYGP
jgi:pimeloyl-ACP methyl ester carboxylesterase